MAAVNPQGSLLKDGWTPNELAHEIPLTRSAREVLDHAQVIAGRAGAARVEPEHLLLAVLSLKNGLAMRALKAMGKQPDTSWAPELGRALADAPGRPLIGSAARYVVYNGLKEAQLLGHYRVDSLHILLGLLYKGTPTAEHLEKDGLSLYDLRQFLQAPGPGVGGLRRRPLPSLDGAISVSPVFAIPLGGFVLGGLGLALGPAPELVVPLTALFIIGGWITSVCLHEFSHALVAYLGGDRSVAAAGYLSFNPLKYTDPMWSIVIPLVFVFLTGFGLPGGGVYINRRVLRTRWWETAASLAGPLGHGIFAILVLAPFWVDWPRLVTEQNRHFWIALAFLAFVEVSSVIFNLVPIPGIDGFGALMPWLPIEIRVQAARLGFGGLWLIWLLVFMGGGLGIWHLIYQLADALHIPVSLALMGRSQLIP
jgi:Zn-dependent protease